MGYLIQEAYEDYTEGYETVSTIKYMIAAYLGFECAQVNVAYLLEKGKMEHRVCFQTTF
jgi:hypothetical protein